MFVTARRRKPTAVSRTRTHSFPTQAGRLNNQQAKPAAEFGLRVIASRRSAQPRVGIEAARRGCHGRRSCQLCRRPGLYPRQNVITEINRDQSTRDDSKKSVAKLKPDH